MKKTLIWTWPTRLFHWFMALGFIGAVVTAGMGEDIGMNPHFAFGMFVGALALFRILFGFFGTRYARFKDFPMGEIGSFVSGMFKRKEDKEYPGHNPLASLVMLGIMLSLLFTAMSGMAIRATKGADFAKTMHGVFVTLSFALIVLHLLGVFSDLFLRKQMGTLGSIFTGYKNVQAEKAELTGGQKIYAIVWLIVPLLAFAVGANLPSKKPMGKHDQMLKKGEVMMDQMMDEMEQEWKEDDHHHHEKGDHHKKGDH